MGSISEGADGSGGCGGFRDGNGGADDDVGGCFQGHHPVLSSLVPRSLKHCK